MGHGERQKLASKLRLLLIISVAHITVSIAAARTVGRPSDESSKETKMKKELAEQEQDFDEVMKAYTEHRVLEKESREKGDLLKAKTIMRMLDDVPRQMEEMTKELEGKGLYVSTRMKKQVAELNGKEFKEAAKDAKCRYRVSLMLCKMICCLQ